MSVILSGDGSITSSVAVTTLTLPIPVFSNIPREFMGNVESQKSDGGVIQKYKKGRRSIRMMLRFVFLTSAQVENMLYLYEQLDQTNWCTLQDHTILTKTAITHQSLTGQKTKIYNSVDFNSWLFPRQGLTAFCMSVIGGGGNTGERKRICNDLAFTTEVESPGFTNNIQVGDTFLIGIPVYIEQEPKIAKPRSHNTYTAELYFEERIY